MTRARTLADLGSASLATDAELASEVSTINSAIAAKPTYAFSATAPSSPSNGDLWMDTSGASPKGKVWNGSEWKSFSGASAATFNEGASTGATFTTLTDPDGDGKNYRLATFSTVGTYSLVIDSPGTAQFLAVGAGGGGGTDQGSSGSGGMVCLTEQSVSGTFVVVVGGGGGRAGNNYQLGGQGGHSRISQGNNYFAFAEGGAGGDSWNNRGNTCGHWNNSTGPSYVSTFNGVSTTYGATNSSQGANTGCGGRGGGGGPTNYGSAGTSGVVFVRVEV